MNTGALTAPNLTAVFDREHYSRDQKPQIFHDIADGYCWGKGVAAVTWKSPKDAIIDNSLVQALISNVYTHR